MKRRYKFLLIIFILLLGMSYESARNREDVPATGNRTAHTTLDEQIRIYEERLAGGGQFDESNDRGPSSAHPSSQGNLIARTGRNIGHAMQNLVREMLRGVVRFFDGVIS